jgi:Homeobox KN domain
MAEGLDDFATRGTDGFYMSPQHTRRMSDQTTPWTPSTQYPEISSTIVPQSSVYQHQVFPLTRASPGLPPPPQDAHARSDRMQNGYDSGYAISIAQYPPLYTQQSTGPGELDQTTFNSRGTPQLEPSQRHRQNYPPTNREHHTGNLEYPRYGAGHYDPYRTTTPYQAPYTELDYPSQTMNDPQNPNFGALGDSIDSRSKRRRGNLPKPVTDLLKEWLHQHLDHPYPSEEDKQYFISRTGLSISQV